MAIVFFNALLIMRLQNWQKRLMVKTRQATQSGVGIPLTSIIWQYFTTPTINIQRAEYLLRRLTQTETQHDERT